MDPRERLSLLLALLLVILTPVLLGQSILFTIVLSAGIYTVAALAITLLMGYTGQASLGQGAFMAIGAYSTAIMTTRYGASPGEAMLVGIILCLISGLAVGYPLLKLKGFYFSAATLAFGILVQNVLTGWYDFTKGESGIPGIPMLSLGGVPFGRTAFFYLVWGIALVVLLLANNLARSQVGRVLLAIRSDETAAETIGIDVGRWKMLIFLLSSVFTGISGSLLAHYLLFVSPSQFGVLLSVELIIISMLGGVTNLFGAIWGAIIWRILPEVASMSGQWQVLLTGLIVILLVIFLPHGISEIHFRSKTKSVSLGAGSEEIDLEN